jgi:hypothetical protein
MAITTTTTYPHKTGALKEDLSDFIQNISPRDTYCYSTFRQTTAKSQVHIFQTDTLASAGANAAAEGAAFSTTADSGTTRLTNYTQIVLKTASVSDSSEQSEFGGIKSMMAYQLKKKGLEWGRDAEYAICINATADIGSAGSARKLKGISGYITTNTATAGSATANPFTGTNGSGILDTLLATMWDAGARPDTVLTSATNSNRIATFTANNTRWTAADSKEIVQALTLYRSNFGDLKIVPSTIMGAAAPTKIFVLQADTWATAWLRQVKTVDIAKTGDSTEKAIVGEFTLEGRAENANGVITLG